MAKFLILFSLLGCFSVDARPDSVVIKFTRAESTNYENPYFGDTTVKVNEGDEKGNTLDLTLTVKEVFPDDTMIMMHLERSDGKAKDFKMRLCDATQEAMLGRYAFENTIPKSFSCPVTPGSYTFKNYTPDQTFLPTSILSDGPFKIALKTAKPNGEPYTSGIFEGEISHSIPIPSAGML